ncbi:MAG TPA: hypothetical protein DEP84_29860 [Chloroflexi bacterium]|nr:hypothetical protein [Chloroflexota bacterium]
MFRLCCGQRADVGIEVGIGHEAVQVLLHLALLLAGFLFLGTSLLPLREPGRLHALQQGGEDHGDNHGDGQHDVQFPGAPAGYQEHSQGQNRNQGD